MFRRFLHRAKFHRQDKNIKKKKSRKYTRRNCIFILVFSSVLCAERRVFFGVALPSDRVNRDARLASYRRHPLRVPPHC